MLCALWSGLSAALFAPGWLSEGDHGDGLSLQQRQEAFWGAVARSLGAGAAAARPPPPCAAFTSSFDQGCGRAAFRQASGGAIALSRILQDRHCHMDSRRLRRLQSPRQQSYVHVSLCCSLIHTAMLLRSGHAALCLQFPVSPRPYLNHAPSMIQATRFMPFRCGARHRGASQTP